MAQAFGGQVIKSPKGWGIGEHDYRVVSREPFMDSVPTSACRPATRTRWFAPARRGVDRGERLHALRGPGLARPAGDLDAAAPGVRAGLCGRADRGAASKVYADEEANRAVASFAGPDDRARVGGWINAFLRG
jgi:hypothetical protein